MTIGVGGSPTVWPEPSEEQICRMEGQEYFRLRKLRNRSLLLPASAIPSFPRPSPRDLGKTGHGSARIPSQVLTHSKPSQEGQESRSPGLSQGGRRTCTRVARETLTPPHKSLHSTWETQCQREALSVLLPCAGLWVECRWGFTPGLSTPTPLAPEER